MPTVGVEHAGGVVGIAAIARNILVVIVVAVGALQHCLELRTVHFHHDQRVLIGHEREHVADLEGVRVGCRGDQQPWRGWSSRRTDGSRPGCRSWSPIRRPKRLPAYWQRWFPHYRLAGHPAAIVVWPTI